MTIKAIETRYAGCKFRSRLEARWAVFFDSIDIRWQYEPEGYHVGFEHQMYLPDFYLEDLGIWVEIKGNFQKLEFDLLAEACDYGHGLPGLHESVGTKKGLLILGNIPKPYDLTPVHSILQHHEGGWVSNGYFKYNDFIIAESAVPGLNFDASWDSDNYNKPWALSVLLNLENGYYFARIKSTKELNMAYEKARSARFEHGTSG